MEIECHLESDQIEFHRRGSVESMQRKNVGSCGQLYCKSKNCKRLVKILERLKEGFLEHTSKPYSRIIVNVSSVLLIFIK